MWQGHVKWRVPMTSLSHNVYTSPQKYGNYKWFYDAMRIAYYIFYRMGRLFSFHYYVCYIHQLEEQV